MSHLTKCRHKVNENYYGQSIVNLRSSTKDRIRVYYRLSNVKSLFKIREMNTEIVLRSILSNK